MFIKNASCDCRIVRPGKIQIRLNEKSLIRLLEWTGLFRSSFSELVKRYVFSGYGSFVDDKVYSLFGNNKVDHNDLSSNILTSADNKFELRTLYMIGTEI